MSRWINGELVRWKPERVVGYPDWWRMDCGCCNGIEWGGSELVECYECGAGGAVYVHVPSRVVALYPGGPLRGRAYDGQLAEIAEVAA